MQEYDNIKIGLIGDIFPGELSFTINYGIRSQFELHKGKPWIDKVKQVIGENDLVIGNLECPLIPKDKAIKKTFYGNPEFAEFLRESGINVLNIANNHILEHGRFGFDATIESLQKAGLGVVGYLENSKPNILYQHIKGYKIAIAGFSNVDLHKINNEDCFAELNEENVLDTLDSMKKNGAELKILCFHWGNEYIQIPSSEQRELAYKCIDAGADIIAGHHPHVIQPYEKYKNSHIFYSLGNFIFDYLFKTNVKQSIVGSIIISKNHSNGVEHNGIKLSYNDFLVEQHSESFLKKFNDIQDSYDKFKLLEVKQYSKNYSRICKNKHLLYRIFMRLHILEQLIKRPIKEKKLLLNNVLVYLRRSK